MLNRMKNNDWLFFFSLISIVGNDIGEVGRGGWGSWAKVDRDYCKLCGWPWITSGLPGLADRDQMDLVKNADALQSVLRGLQVAGEQAEEGVNTDRTKVLQRKIVKLLKSSTRWKWPQDIAYIFVWGLLKFQLTFWLCQKNVICIKLYVLFVAPQAVDNDSQKNPTFDHIFCMNFPLSQWKYLIIWW